MKILIVSPIFPPEIGGPATYVTELASRLKKGHQITIITFCSKVPQTISGCRLIYIPTQASAFGRQYRLFKSILMESFRHQLIYSQGSFVVGLASCLASKLSRKPLIIKFVGDEIWETARNHGHTRENLENFFSRPPLVFLPKIIISYFVLNLSSTVLTPSVYLKNFLQHYYHLKPIKIHVIVNAVEITHITAKKHPFLLVYVGRFVKWKHIDIIIKAIKLARNPTKPWILHLIGSGPEMVYLKALIRRLNAGSWVKLLGSLPRNQVHQHIAHSQALILYSSYEGLSHTLIEAMLLHTHVFASNISSNRETLHGYGQLINQSSPLELASAINHPKPQLDSAQKFAQHHYSWHRHLTQFTQLCRLTLYA